MRNLAHLAPRVIEALYAEALMLAENVRPTFAPPIGGAPDDGARRIALSCEAMRTTTRMMHAIGWLLNLRALMLGELTEAQLRRHGTLARDVALADPERMALLPPAPHALVASTEQFYARLLRLEQRWHNPAPAPVSAMDRLRARLNEPAPALAP